MITRLLYCYLRFEWYLDRGSAAVSAARKSVLVWCLVNLLMLNVAACQTVSGSGGVISGNGGSISFISTAGLVTLPQLWVNNHQCDGALNSPNQTINFPSVGTGGSWTGGGPYTANSSTSLQQAINDAETYRQGHPTAGAIRMNIPAGSLFTSAAHTLILPQTAGDTSTNCIALVTTGNLPAGVTVCAHGTQDPISESSDPGTRDPSCTISNDVAQMFTVETSGCSSGNGTCSALDSGSFDTNNVGPHNFLIIGAEFREAAADTHVITSLITMGHQATDETLNSQLPSSIFFDRDWFHNNCLDNRTGCTSGITHTIIFDCPNCAITNSQFSENIVGGQQSQYIEMINQPGPFKIDHNWMDGAGQRIICGGTFTTLPNNQQSCTNGEIRRNRLTYPAGWMDNTNSFKPNGQSPNSISGFELKSADKILFDGNICENIDTAGAQYKCIAINPRAYNNGAPSFPQYFVNVTNVTITNNIHRHVCRNSAAEFATRSNPPPNGNGTSQGMALINISNNLFYDYDHPSFCTGSGNGQGFAWSNGFTAINGTTARDAAGLTTTFSGINGGVGEAQTDLNVGDYVVIVGCTDTTFNVGNSSTVHGPPALAGTNPNALTVVYANPGTANATDNSTTCQVVAMQGFTQFQTVAHNTFILNSGGFGWNVFLGSGIGFAGTMFMRNNKITDNIIGGQGVKGQGLSDSGTPTSQAANWDSASLEWHHDIYIGRTCSNYFDELTSGGSLVKPPTTSFCPATDFCTTSDPTVGSCVGYNGLMSQSVQNTNLADWHGYRLCHAGDATCAHPSLYAAGQTDQASDGSDRGAIFTSLDSAQTQTQYTCGSACGSGPFPD